MLLPLLLHFCPSEGPSTSLEIFLSILLHASGAVGIVCRRPILYRGQDYFLRSTGIHEYDSPRHVYSCVTSHKKKKNERVRVDWKSSLVVVGRVPVLSPSWRTTRFFLCASYFRDRSKRPSLRGPFIGCVCMSLQHSASILSPFTATSLKPTAVADLLK